MPLPRTRFLRKSSNKGFNLIEAAIVLGVVGLVIGGIWIASAAIQNKRQTNQIVQTVGMLHSNLQKLFKNHRAALYAFQMTKSFMETVAPPGTTAKLYGGVWSITDEFGNYYVLSSLTPDGLMAIYSVMPREQCVTAMPRLAVSLKPYLLSPGILSGSGEIVAPADAATYCDEYGVTINLGF